MEEAAPSYAQEADRRPTGNQVRSSSGGSAQHPTQEGSGHHQHDETQPDENRLSPEMKMATEEINQRMEVLEDAISKYLEVGRSFFQHQAELFSERVTELYEAYAAQVQRMVTDLAELDFANNDTSERLSASRALIQQLGFNIESINYRQGHLSSQMQ